MNTSESLNYPRASRHVQSRNWWPISIALCFVLFVLFLAGFIAFAARNHAELVRRDYYEEEIRFQQQVDRVARSRELASGTQIAYDAAERCIHVTLPPSHAAGSTGRIQLYRPSDSTLDQVEYLALERDGTQKVSAAQLRAGLWKVRVQWTFQGEEYYLDRAIVIPESKRS